VLAKHRVSVHSARINTLGERVEDVFLVDGSRLTADNRLQIQLEQICSTRWHLILRCPARERLERYDR
jgi:UTP:GlnB (protein PII) uridylyltransferase